MNWRKLLTKKFYVKWSSAFLINTFTITNCSNANNSKPLTVEQDTNNQQLIENFQYAIIGLGAAGQSAKNEILKLDREKNIILIDSFIKNSTTIDGNRVKYEKKEISGIDIVSKLIYFKDNSSIQYEKCLISSGAIPSKVNKRYFDQGIQNHLFEIQDKESYKILINLVTNGNHVTVLGSNWNAIQLCNILTKHAMKAGFKNTVTLLMPSFGPMSLTLPRYLSNAISKRLISNNIELITHSQIRYISNPDTLPYEITSKISPNLAVYISKTFDMLSTSAFTTDAVIICADSSPTNFKSISDLTDSYLKYIPGIEFDLINHKIIANSFLMASSDLYVSGDICSVPTALGRAVFTGVDHAVESGRIAARNMTGKRQLYNYLPAYEAHAEELGLHFVSVGNCSASLETYGYWWKPTTPSSSSSHDLNQQQQQQLAGKGSNKTPHPTLIDNLKTSLLNTNFISTQSKKPVTVFKNETPFGKLKVAARHTNPSNINLSLNTTTDSASSSTTPPPPLGIGVVFYVSQNIIEGVLLSGVSSSLLTASSSPDIGTETDTDKEMERIKDAARAVIGRNLTCSYHHHRTRDTILTSEGKEGNDAHLPPHNPTHRAAVSRLEKVALLNTLAVDILLLAPSTASAASGLAEVVATGSPPTHRYSPRSLSAALSQKKSGNAVIRNSMTLEQLFAMGDNDTTSEIG